MESDGRREGLCLGCETEIDPGPDELAGNVIWQIDGDVAGLQNLALGCFP